MLESIQEAPVASFFFAITLVTSLVAWAQPEVMQRFLLVPQRVVHAREWDRLFSHTLIHADLMHLAFNLFTYYAFAFALEKYFLGHLPFLLLYLGGAIGASLPDVIKYRDRAGFASLGASGAISAIVFAFILFAPTTELVVSFILPMPAWLFGILYLVFCYAMDRQQASDMFGNRINHGAHFWGAVVGIVLTPIVAPQVLMYLAMHLGLGGQ
jgi:membrane associated rhomboid family serine protease